MSFHPHPPFNGQDMPRGVCSYEDCGGEGKWHVVWSYGNESVLCDPDKLDAQRRYVYLGIHEIEEPCLVEGGVYDEDRNCCYFPDEDDDDGPVLRAEAPLALVGV